MLERKEQNNKIALTKYICIHFYNGLKCGDNDNEWKDVLTEADVLIVN